MFASVGSLRSGEVGQIMLQHVQHLFLDHLLCLQVHNTHKWCIVNLGIELRYPHFRSVSVIYPNNVTIIEMCEDNLGVNAT